MPRIDLEPIYLELAGDRKREIAYTMGSEIMLRERRFISKPMAERIEDGPNGEARYAVHRDAIAEHLFAVLQRDARRNGEMLERQDVEDLITSNEEVFLVLEKITLAMNRYYGKPEVGEATPPSQARRRESKSRSK